MQIQPFTSSDIPFLTLLQPEGWPDVIPVYKFYTTSSFCYPIKITISNELIGIGTTIIHDDVAWLAHIIVHPDYRNRGIGKHITDSLIESIDPRICKTIYLVATALGEPVYEKLGFETETEYLFYHNFTKDSSFAPSSNIVPYNKTYNEQIKQLDQSVSGEDRFFHFEKYLSTAFVYVSHARIEGYYIPDFHEGVIVANTSKAGVELMHLRLQSKENAAFPINNTTATAYMNIHGYVPFKTAKRMRLGEFREIDFTKMYNRIAGSIG